MKISNKAAMFGLEGRALRKQSGGLFLASLRKLTSKRLVAGQQATRVKTQRGAMFGLDARIALAIFGALSVISGAALYSAIQDSKVTALVTELSELGKAVDSYYLDTGVLPPKHSTVKYALHASELLADTNTTAGWNGPYSSLKYVGPTALASSVIKGHNLATQYRQISSWGGVSGVDTAPPAECVAAPCAIYLNISFVPLSLAKAVDKKVDVTEDFANGRVRIWDYTDGTANIYYQYSIAPVQP